MKFIGNYSHWIKDEWVDYLLNNDGYARPNAIVKTSSEQTEKFAKSDYDMSATFWSVFIGENFPFDISPPNNVDWRDNWAIVKQLPGQFMPMHIDSSDEDSKIRNNYWMSFKDYEPGHSLIYTDKLIANYKKGDLFEYDDPYALHGSFNIGYTTRLILNFSVDTL